MFIIERVWVRGVSLYMLKVNIYIPQLILYIHKKAGTSPERYKKNTH